VSEDRVRMTLNVPKATMRFTYVLSGVMPIEQRVSKCRKYGDWTAQKRGTHTDALKDLPTPVFMYSV